jgi:hypothetical protein
MKKAGILLVPLLFSATLFGQYFSPWGISPFAVTPNTQTSATRISSFSLGGVFSTEQTNDTISFGLQQTGLEVYISIWDTLDIEDLGEFSVYDSSPIGYHLRSDSLGSSARIEIHPDKQNMGEYTWDEAHQLFTFKPDLQRAVFSDTVIFLAFNDTDTISRQIHFIYLPQLPSEQHAMGLSKVSSGDNSLMNDVVSVSDPSDSSLHIAGRILLFNAELDDRGICEYSAQGDADPRFDTINKVIIYADSLVIHESLRFPGCDVTIYARKLVFDNPAACVNTSPYESTAINSGPDPSDDGKNAGYVHLYVGDMQMGPGLHFILNGGKGQSATPGAGVPPGHGGDGGELQTPVYISGSNYRFNRGASGEHAVDSLMGSKGEYLKVEYEPTNWIHARNIQPEMNYLRMQYMENNLDYVKTRCIQLNELLGRKFARADTAVSSDEADLMNALNEIREMQNRLNNQRDYYGNPIGWVPLLSFEVYKGVFENEVDNAFNLMFLSYLINKSDAGIVQVNNGMKKARTSMISEVTALQTSLNDNIRRLETYENIYAQLNIKADSLKGVLKKVEERLLKEAKANVERRRALSIFQSIASIGGSILSMIPNPACQVIGQGLSTVSELNLEEPFSLENASLVVQASANAYEGYKSYKDKTIEKLGTDQKVKDLTGITQAEMDDIDKGLSKWNTMNKVAGGIVSFAQDYNDAKSQVTVGDDEIKAELEKLKAESQEYQGVLGLVEATLKEKQQMHENIDYSMNAITNAIDRIGEDRMAVQSLTKSIQEGAGKRDIRTLQYANSIEKRAFERLQKYHYLMSRAFEYRTLMPWTQSLNLESVRQGMFTYVMNLSPDDEDLIIPQEQFNAIKGIYLDQLHEIADSILANFEQGGFTKNRTTSFELSKGELELLNGGKEFFIDPYERNLFGLDKENIRILNIGVVKCVLEDGTELTGSLDDSGLKSGSFTEDGPFEIVMVHQGYSKLQSNGEIYYFNHNRVGSSKFEWRSNIDIVGNKITQDRISNSDKSLLHSLVDNLTDSELTFCSEPSAWADISMQRISGSDTRKIVSLVMEINFDYKVLPEDLYMLKVETDGEVSPYYLLSTADVNGYKDGKGDFYRTFNKATAVAITAQNQYGRHKFQRWDKVSLSGVGGRSLLTTSTTAGILTNAHTHLISVYESMDSVWITAPAGQQHFSNGNNLLITWDQTMDHDMKVELFSNGFYVRTIVDSVMENSFNWTVPQNFTVPQYSDGTFQVKVTSRLNNTLYDFSDNLQFWPLFTPGIFRGNNVRMLIHPVPATDVLWISLEGLAGPQATTWAIHATDGRLIQKGKLTFENGEVEKSLPLAGLAKGTYILVIEADRQTLSGLFIVE